MFKLNTKACRLTNEYKKMVNKLNEMNLNTDRYSQLERVRYEDKAIEVYNKLTTETYNEVKHLFV